MSSDAELVRSGKRFSLPVAGDVPKAADHHHFGRASKSAAANERLKAAVNYGVVKNDKLRQSGIASLPGGGDPIRTLAGQIKQHTLDYLDYYLVQLKAAVEARGGHVHFARNGDEAKRIILEICRAEKVKSIIKSKSMVSEEIELAHVFEREGYDVV